MFKIFVMGVLANLGLMSILNRKGEVGADGKEITPPAGEKLLTQSQVDAIVQDRLGREKQKYADYDALKNKVSEYEKSQDEKQLKLLEEQKKYDDALKIHNSKLEELQGLVTRKDTEITDMKIGGVLMSEINKQNAYTDEAMALLKSQAVFNKENGSVTIKGRDANGLEKQYSVEEGVKIFLTLRPHLVKAQQRAGSGTPQGITGGAGAGVQDLAALNAKLKSALERGDRKTINEVKAEISVLRGVAKATS